MFMKIRKHPHLPHSIFYYLSSHVRHLGTQEEAPNLSQLQKWKLEENPTPDSSTRKQRINCQQSKSFILQSRKVSKTCLEVLLGPEPGTYINSERRILED